MRRYHERLCLDRCEFCVCALPLGHVGEHWCANDACPTSWVGDDRPWYFVELTKVAIAEETP